MDLNLSVGEYKEELKELKAFKKLAMRKYILQLSVSVAIIILIGYLSFKVIIIFRLTEHPRIALIVAGIIFYVEFIFITTKIDVKNDNSISRLLNYNYKQDIRSINQLIRKYKYIIKLKNAGREMTSQERVLIHLKGYNPYTKRISYDKDDIKIT